MSPRDWMNEEEGASERCDPAPRLRAKIGSLGEVRSPNEADEPILAPAVRGALHSWLVELNARDELADAGLKPRTTALLYGPPGTGKTTLAHHLAARLGVPLVVVGAENLLRPYLGEAEKMMADLFRAIAGINAVVFLDEIDAIGRSRALGGGSSASEGRMSMLTVMLRRLEEHKGILLGATNRHDQIDPALWRRFHLQISVDLPGEEERFAILKRYGLPFLFADDDLDLLTTLAEGASPALLRGLMEGFKRALILGKRGRWPIDDPVELARRIIVSLSPPPEIERPPLWSDEAALASLRSMTWPPQRTAP